jgi:hypothetical protein
MSVRARAFGGNLAAKTAVLEKADPLTSCFPKMSELPLPVRENVHPVADRWCRLPRFGAPPRALMILATNGADRLESGHA